MHADSAPYMTIDEILNQFDISGSFYIRLVFWCASTWLADAVTVHSFGFLSTCAGIYLGWSGSEIGVSSSMIMVGEVIGALTWIISADSFGRRLPGIVSFAIFAIASWLSGIASNLVFYCTLRFFVGVGIGGSCVPLETLSEIVPSKSRGTVLALGPLVESCGAIFINIVASSMLSFDGQGEQWRTLAFAVAMFPTLAFIGLYTFFPESPRWYLAESKFDEAEHLIHSMAKMNGTILRPFTFKRHALLDGNQPRNYETSSNDDHDVRAELTSYDAISLANDFKEKTHPKKSLSAVNHFALLKELFNGDLRRKSIVLSLMWLTRGVCTVGGILFINRLHNIHNDSKVCQFDFQKIIFNGTSELIGGVVLIPIIDKFGRIPTILGFNVLAVLSLVVMLLNVSNDVHVVSQLTLMSSWIMRLSFFCSTGITCIISMESFRTRHRSTAFALVFLASRLGAIIGITIVANNYSNATVEGIFLFFVMVMAVSGLFLKETKDAAMD